ncbi:hypothetical protein BYT27DRAFT_7263140 [Phlegmacium glaucopus]|nr:hypothetical protein BYT27DRAFT_7263140 [Phlegmacium glaucopus]
MVLPFHLTYGRYADKDRYHLASARFFQQWMRKVRKCICFLKAFDKAFNRYHQISGILFGVPPKEIVEMSERNMTGGDFGKAEIRSSCLHKAFDIKQQLDFEIFDAVASYTQQAREEQAYSFCSTSDIKFDAVAENPASQQSLAILVPSKRNMICGAGHLVKDREINEPAISATSIKPTLLNLKNSLSSARMMFFLILVFRTPGYPTKALHYRGQQRGGIVCRNKHSSFQTRQHRI